MIHQGASKCPLCRLIATSRARSPPICLICLLARCVAPDGFPRCVLSARPPFYTKAYWPLESTPRRSGADSVGSAWPPWSAQRGRQCATAIDLTTFAFRDESRKACAGSVALVRATRGCQGRLSWPRHGLMGRMRRIKLYSLPRGIAAYPLLRKPLVSGHEYMIVASPCLESWCERSAMLRLCRPFIFISSQRGCFGRYARKFKTC